MIATAFPETGWGRHRVITPDEERRRGRADDGSRSEYGDEQTLVAQHRQPTPPARPSPRGRRP